MVEEHSTSANNNSTTADQDRLQALDDLAYIKRLTVQTRNSAAEADPYFNVWGIVWIIGFGSETIGLYDYLHWIWLVLSIAGMGMTVYISIRHSKKNPLPAVVDRQLIMSFYGFTTITGLVVVLIAVGFLQFSVEHIGLYAVILVAILYLFMGIVLGKALFYMGLWFAVLAAGNAILFPPYHAAVMAVLGGGSFLLTGWILKGWRKDS
jgi:hypothetical protein